MKKDICAAVGCRRKGVVFREFMAKQNKLFGEFAWVMLCQKCADERKGEEL